MTIEKRLDTAGGMDEPAFEKLFREYFTSLMAFSRRILGDEDDAKEVVHQVFIKLWERRSEIDLSTSLKSYLFTSVNNRSLNVIRDRRKFSSEEVPERVGEWDVSAQLESMELEEQIHKVIDSLPERCRVIFCMSRIEKMTYQEIADSLSLSIKTVETQIGRALTIFRKKLSHSYPNYLKK